MIKREHTLFCAPTPEELASEFANMGDDQQALFFNELARLTKNWKNPFCFQLQGLVDRPELTVEGKRIMEQIGEYGSSCPQQKTEDIFDDLLSAAKTGAKWMRWWLEQDECECEYGHTCGKNERLRELKQIEAAIAAAEGRRQKTEGS